MMRQNNTGIITLPTTYLLGLGGEENRCVLHWSFAAFASSSAVPTVADSATAVAADCSMLAELVCY
jgi:hypothetical protein